MHGPARIVSVERYSAIAQLFHWITAALVIVAYIASVGGRNVYAPANDFSRSLHELLGFTVFVLTLARVCWRAIFPPPSADLPAWVQLGARISQWAIYGLLVMLPVTEIVGTWLEGHPLTVLAVGNFPPLIPQSRPAGHLLTEIHGWLGNVLIWLAGFHAAAALYHHFWRRDTTLISMLPGRPTA